jgi:uncharacterized membrane protein
MTVLLHFFRYRRRLWIAALIGIIVACLIPTPLHLLTRVLFGWNLAAWLYMISVWIMMARADGEVVKRIAMREDESTLMVLSVVSLAAILSIVAIVFELGTSKGAHGGPDASHFVFTGATVVASWFLIPTLFTLHYAELFYNSDQKNRALQFPDRDVEPDYWDFLYFSFTIAVASQTSDIALASREMRRAGLAQSVLAFYFNASILALSINIAASALSS